MSKQESENQNREIALMMELFDMGDQSAVETSYISLKEIQNFQNDVLSKRLKDVEQKSKSRSDLSKVPIWFG